MPRLVNISDFDENDPFYRKMDENPFTYWTVLTSKHFLEGVQKNLPNYTRNQLGRIYNWLDNLIPFVEDYTELPYTSIQLRETRDVVAKKYNSKLIQNLVERVEPPIVVKIKE